jgi:hypothetical protein
LPGLAVRLGLTRLALLRLARLPGLTVRRLTRLLPVPGRTVGRLARLAVLRLTELARILRAVCHGVSVGMPWSAAAGSMNAKRVSIA